MARPMISSVSDSSAHLPNVLPPRVITETRKPERPSCRYSIVTRLPGSCLDAAQVSIWRSCNDQLVLDLPVDLKAIARLQVFPDGGLWVVTFAPWPVW